MQKLDPNKKGKSKMIGVCLTYKQIKFIEKQEGKTSEIIRNLIDQEIERRKKAG